MTDLTGLTPQNTYKDLLQISNSNSGLDSTLRSVESGAGTNSALSLSTGQAVITSANAAAFAVGPNGATNPSLLIDSSAASAATGISITSAGAGGGVTLSAISSGTDEFLSISSKGSSELILNSGTTGSNSMRLRSGGTNRIILNSSSFTFANTQQYVFTPTSSSTAATVRYSYTSVTETNLTAGVEAPNIVYNLANSRSHASNTAIALQRDFRIAGTSHAFASAGGTITDLAALAVTPSTASTNATATNNSAILVQSAAVGNATNSYGLNVSALTGATNNWAARFVGDVRVDSGAIKETRINRRVVSLTDAATVTPNSDTTDVGILTSLSQDSTIANPTGTPVDGQQLMLRIKSTVARNLTFGAQYRGSADLALPTATSGGSLTDYLGFIWNAADSKWDYFAKNSGF